MCSQNDDDLGEQLFPSSQILGSDLVCEELCVCKKCGKETKTYKLGCRQAECRDCFLGYVRHKFRAALGASKVLPRTAKVLIEFDGSGEAAVLVDIVHHERNLDSFKRLQCDACSVLYIDYGELQHQDTELKQRRNNVLAVRDYLSLYKGLEIFICSISSNGEPKSIFKLEDFDMYLIRDRKSELQFQKHMKSLSSCTSRQDFLKYHRNKMVAAVGNHLDCTFILQPDITINVAANLLSAIVLGRGKNASLDVELQDSRYGDNVQYLRPIRNVTSEEMQLYLRLQALCVFCEGRYGQFEGTGASLQNLTYAFISDLQKSFSSTVSTVFRASTKMASKDETHLDDSSPICTFCHSHLDCESSTTLLAIEFSRLMSEGTNITDQRTSLDNTAHERLLGMLNGRFSNLCHACQNIQKDNKIDT